MSNINAKQDGNQTFSSYGISGTLGASYGTSETRPLTVTENGLLKVAVDNAPIGSQILVNSIVGTAGGSQFGTLIAASGGGTSIYMTAVQTSMLSGTADLYVGFGTALTGGSVLVRGLTPAGQGITRQFVPVIKSGTNAELCYEFADAGTAFIGINYWVGP